jgi:hypothetical protein
MKKMVIALFTLSICLASGNIKKQMDDLMRSLQYKYQISGPEDLYKLKMQQTPQHGRVASRDMGDLVGDWRMEEEYMELFVTVGSDQSILNPFSMLGLVEAEGSITATTNDYQTELIYLLDGTILEDGDGGDGCDISCEDEYNYYNDYGIEPSDIYCECCHEDYPIDEICEDDGGGVGVEFEYESVSDLYANYGSILETVGTGCDGCTGNLDGMDAVTSFDIAVQSEFENWANNFEFAEYYFQFIDENENDAYDGGEIYAVTCEGDTSMTVAYDGSVYASQFEYFWMEAYDFDWESDDDDDNILPNGGFEDVYEAGNGWQLYATDWIWHPTYAVNHHVELTGNYIYGSYIPFEAYDGDYSLKLWGQYSGAENKTAYYQTFTDLEAGTEIHAEAMLMSHQDHWIGNGSNTVTVFASYWDAEWGFIGRDDSEVFSGADEYNMWHERGVDAVVPEGVSYVNIGLEFSQMDDSQGGSVYIDNMNVHIYDDDGDREDNSRNYDALTFAQDYVNDNSSDYSENTFDLESEFSLVVDGYSVSGGLGGDDPGNCEINWPEDPYKIAVYSFVSKYVLDEGESVGCFLDDSDLDQTYAQFVIGMEDEWTGGGDDDDGDDDGPGLMIMNMNLFEFFMVMFGVDPDSLNIQNPTILSLGSSNDDDNIDMIEGVIFGETGAIELMADSAEAVVATSMDTLNLSFTFTNLSLYDSTETVALTVSGTIGPGWIDFIAGVEQAYPLLEGMEDMFEENDDDEAYMSFYEDSTGMEIQAEYFEGDEYYYEGIYVDTSYFTWYATSDSLFLYGEDDYYDELDTTELAYFINGIDTLNMGASWDACEDEDSFEECIEFASEEIAGLDELEDLQSLRISMGRVFIPGSYTAVDPGNGSLPQDFNLYANYPNPFNPVTTIRFDVGQNSGDNTLLRIYDITGRSVTTLINGQLQTGTYEIQWDARGFASGIYFSELISGTTRHTQKMVLLK